MRFLACVAMPQMYGDNWARPGEPVVPNFPTAYANSFLGARSFKPTMRAVVAEFQDLDIDELADRMHAQFPGLPRHMIDTYVLETAKVAHEIPVGTECSVYTSWESTKIVEAATGQLHELWSELPL